MVLTLHNQKKKGKYQTLPRAKLSHNADNVDTEILIVELPSDASVSLM